MADKVTWNMFEEKYAGLFLSGVGNVTKSLRIAFGFLIIHNRYQLSDRELVELIMENPYYLYFIGLPGYQDKTVFDVSMVVIFRKRITVDMFNEANKYLLTNKDEDRRKTLSSGSGGDKMPAGRKLLRKGCMPWMPPVSQPTSGITRMCPC